VVLYIKYTGGRENDFNVHAYKVLDVWTGKTTASAGPVITAAAVPAHETVLLRLT
jgi:hypothetical protein